MPTEPVPVRWLRIFEPDDDGATFTGLYVCLPDLLLFLDQNVPAREAAEQLAGIYSDAGA